jgi:uncharacterized membrane protein
MTRWRPIAATIVSVLGLGVATYLTYSHYSNPSATQLTCPFGGSASSTIDCGAVLTSSWSTILGLPVALYGAVFFLFMVVVNLPAMWRSESRLLARLRLAAAVAGMGMVLYLVGVELLEVKHICIWCTSVHVLQFILFLLVITGWYDTGWAWSQVAQDEQDLSPGAELSGAPRMSPPRRTAIG